MGFDSLYQIDRRTELGKGTFACVKRGRCKRTGELVAVKVVDKSRFAHIPKVNDMFRRELTTLQALRHHNLTSLVDYFEDQSTICMSRRLLTFRSC